MASDSTHSVGTVRSARQGRPALTDHVVDDRWPQRMPASARDAAHGLREASPAPGMEAHPYFGHPDRVWVYGGRTKTGRTYFAVLVERGATITTTYRVQSIDDSPHAGPLRAYLSAVGQQGGLYHE
jgi:hypothetical protein